MDHLFNVIMTETGKKAVVLEVSLDHKALKALLGMTVKKVSLEKMDETLPTLQCSGIIYPKTFWQKLRQLAR